MGQRGDRRKLEKINAAGAKIAVGEKFQREKLGF